jgi:DNA-binding response OmpR family regulator
VLRIGQTERRITKKENQVLQLLCSKKNQIVRRDEILTELWGENDYFKGRSLDVFVARLRKYLSDDKNIRIETIYGVGFVLNDD